MGSHGDPMKWQMPGWRIEQRYANNVLIGNWGEERHTFQKGNSKHNSTNRTDFRHYNTHRPDVTIRRNAQIQNDGLGKELLFYHHGNRYSNNLVSWYDEHYNNRERDEANKLPELRHWDSHQLAWVPEKSDHPINGAPSNFGLQHKLKSKWAEQIAEETQGNYSTTYRKSFIPARADFRQLRHATPKAMSATTHVPNKTNKDLNLRNTATLYAPEVIMALPPPQSRIAVKS